MTPEEVVSDAVRAGQITAELQKLAKKYNLRFDGLMPDEIHDGAMDVIAPQDMNTVRSFPSELHSAGIEHLLFSLDRTVMEGESGGYCADWHAEQSRKYVADIVRDTSVKTPSDIVAWLDRRDRATRLHLA
jgi:hypothetical protein